MGYRQVYFRIKSDYAFHFGWKDAVTEEQFKKETRKIFQDAGWTLHPGENAASDTATKGQQELYLHPMNFSGVILEESIPELESIMTGAHTFQHYATDLYEPYLEMDDDAYLAHLEAQREQISNSILDCCRTKRRNLFVTSPIAERVAKQYAVHRLCDRHNRSDLASRFVGEVVEQLIAEVKLVTAQTRNGLGLRTATDKELSLRQTGDAAQTEGQMNLTM